MTGIDTADGGRIALAVFTQYRMATTLQLHRLLAPQVRIDPTRRRVAKLRGKGLVDRVTLPQAGRLRAWSPTTEHGARIACEWPELPGRQPLRLVADPTRLRRPHSDGDRDRTHLHRGRQPAQGPSRRPGLDPGIAPSHRARDAVIPDALMFHRRSEPVLMRVFVEVDRATREPERMAAKLTAYARLHLTCLLPCRGSVASPTRCWRNRRRGGGATRASPECCPFCTQPARPVSNTASAPCTPSPALDFSNPLHDRTTRKTSSGHDF